MQSPHKLDLLQLMGAFLLQFDVQQVLKSIPFIHAWGSRGSNFSASAERHTSKNSNVQLPAPGGPTALLSA